MKLLLKIYTILSVLLLTIFAYCYYGFRGEVNYEEICEFAHSLVYLVLTTTLFLYALNSKYRIWIVFAGVAYFRLTLLCHQIYLLFSTDYINTLLVATGIELFTLIAANYKKIFNELVWMFHTKKSINRFNKLCFWN